MSDDYYINVYRTSFGTWEAEWYYHPETTESTKGCGLHLSLGNSFPDLYSALDAAARAIQEHAHAKEDTDADTPDDTHNQADE